MRNTPTPPRLRHRAHLGRFAGLAIALALSACANSPILGPTTAIPVDKDTRKAIDRVQYRIDQALLANNADALDVHLTRDVTRTGPSGVTSTREEWLTQIRTGQIRYLAVRRCDTLVLQYDSAIVVTGLVDIVVDKPTTGVVTENNRYLRTYVLEDGQWHLASHQAMTAPDGGSCAALGEQALP